MSRLARISVAAGAMFAAIAVLALDAVRPALAAPADWQRDVLPLLKNRCVKCHGIAKTEGQLRLHDAAAVARGGESGAAVVPRDVERSLLWKRVAADEMPEDRPLSADEKEILRQWIAAGAPGLSPSSKEQANANHWAFRALQRPPTPLSSRVLRSPLDQFISKKLAQRGLKPHVAADRATLARRLSFDLTGLPPTPDDAAEFVDDRSPDALERYVDRLLASPQFGVRAARHWLDAAGYADSNGYFHADTDRPLAYKYRDWVVRSLNADMPFDQFVREQLAGDELAGGVPTGPVSREVIDLLTATHFLRNGPDGTGESDGNPDERRADKYFVLEGTAQIIGSSLLGLTVQCARCHDHKFEPIAHREYYQLQAIIYPAFNVDQWLQPNQRVVHAATADQWDDWQRRKNDRAAELARHKAEFEAWEKEHPKARTRGKSSPDDESQRKATEAMRKELKAQIESLERQIAEKPGALACVYDVTAKPPDVKRLDRGQYAAGKEAVAADVPAALWKDGRGMQVDPQAAATRGATGRRLAFARWLTSPETPAAALLARVTVNRCWQNHFGRGIVATPDNLGYSGAAPTHPELFEHLAIEFIDGGWSAKRLVRTLLTSDTYRQSSRPYARGREIDPDDALLWRARLRRLDADCVRDAMLTAAGNLDLRLAGRYVPTTQTGVGEVVVDEKHPDACRRSLYLQQRRTQLASMLSVFDAPSVTFNCTRRPTTTIPLQSLSLLNSEFARHCAERFAGRLTQQKGDSTEARIGQAFQIAFGRAATEDERAAARRLLASDPSAWTDFCQILLAGNAFLYVE